MYDSSLLSVHGISRSIARLQQLLVDGCQNPYRIETGALRYLLNPLSVLPMKYDLPNCVTDQSTNRSTKLAPLWKIKATFVVSLYLHQHGASYENVRRFYRALMLDRVPIIDREI